MTCNAQVPPLGYKFALGQVEVEIETSEPVKLTSWREMALDALSEIGDLDECPDVSCTNMEEWRFVCECLQGVVLWDTITKCKRRWMLTPPGPSG